MSDTLRVELLGRLRVVRGGEVTTHFETRQTKALLAILALSLPRACSRESLLEHLWPDEDPDATRPRLRQSLSVLRGILNAPEAPPALVTDREEVRLDPSRVTTDLAEFQAALGAAARAAAPADKQAHLEAALRLAQGELLPGASEDVILAARDRQAESRRGALVSLADLLREAGDHEAAIEVARQAVTADRCDEQANVALIRAYSADGQTVEATRRAREMERVLREELDAAPSEATRAFVESLRAPAAGPAAAASLPPTLPASLPNGPAEDTPAPTGARQPGRKWLLVLCVVPALIVGALWHHVQEAKAPPVGGATTAAAEDDPVDVYLRGARTRFDFEQVIERDESALRRNSHDASADVSKAYAYVLMGYYAYIPSRRAVPEALAALSLAIKDASGNAHTLAEAYTCLGWVDMVYRRDWVAAQAEYAKAKQFSANYATAYQWDSLALMLRGRQQESLAEIQVASRVDRSSFIIATSVGGRYYYSRQYGRAIRQFTRVLSDDPTYALTHFWRGLAWAGEGDQGRAQADLRAAVDRSGRAPLFLAFLGQDYARNGQRGQALLLRAELQRRSRTEYVDPVCLAVLACGLGDRKTAFSLFDRALREDDGALILLEEASPAFDFLASDPRYVHLRRQMHLPTRVSLVLTKISR